MMNTPIANETGPVAPLQNLGTAVAQVEPIMHSLALQVQIRLARITEMARVIYDASDDLPLDCQPGLYRVCAEVILEAADTATEEAERVETSCAALRCAMHGEA